MRRSRFPLVLVPVVASLLCGAAAPAHARVADFEQRVPVAMPAGAPDAAGAARAGRWLTTAAQRAPQRFDLLGVRWRGGKAHVALRVQRADGGWSRWIEALPSEQPPAPGTGATHGTGPVWTGGGSRYQLRFSAPVRDARVHFVAIERSRGTPAPAAQPAANGRPAIVGRSTWDPGNDCAPRVTPIYGRVDFGLVHHTVSLNGYGRGDTPAIVLAICRFHRNANGWNDIGYNLLVDRYGVVYEGREGGVSDPVVGAQAQGWNSVSTGVAAIGDFSGAGAAAGMLQSIARVLAWKLGLAGVPARGTVREVSIGGDLNRWPEGARVDFERVAGHRDGDETECPGGGLYAQLPALSALVARSLPTPRDLLTISPVVAAQPQSGPTYVTGRLARRDGSRPAGEAVVVQQLLDGTWSEVGSARTGADGIWSAVLPLTRNGAVRALAATASGSELASTEIPLHVSAGVSVRASTRHARAGTTIELTGATTPPKRGVRVVIERRLDGERRSDGRRRPSYRRVRTSDPIATVEGRFSATVRLPAAGIYRVTVRTLADGSNAAGSSRTLTVRAMRKR